MIFDYKHVMLAFVVVSTPDRSSLIAEARANFVYVHENGGQENYSYEKIADCINHAAGTEWDKSFARRFIIGETDVPRLDIDDVVALFICSDEMKAEVEEKIQRGLSAARPPAAPQP
jgi:hypothetical protein